MIKLISAHFARLRRDRLFRLCLGVILVYAAAYMLNGCRQAAMDMAEYHYTLDKYYFHFALSIGAFISVFSSIFFGTEYSNGTIRNKIVDGHTRDSIYLSNLCVTFAAGLCMLLVWCAAALVGVPFLGLWEMGAAQLLAYLLVAVLFTAALCAVFTLVNSLSSNTAVTVVVSMLLFLGLLIAASLVYNRLGEPETISGVVVTSGGMELGEPAPNPRYISGTARKILAFLCDFLPTGQGLQMAFVEITAPARMALSSAFITISATLCGLGLFRRKTNY